jgi:hypothetical protein
MSPLRPPFPEPSKDDTPHAAGCRRWWFERSGELTFEASALQSPRGQDARRRREPNSPARPSIVIAPGAGTATPYW